MNYKARHRTFQLTPHRKRIGKAVARGNRKSVAMECLKDPTTRTYLFQRIGVLIRNEMKAMCSEARGSVLCNQSPHDLEVFTWDKLFIELSESAPILLSLLQECARTKRHQENSNAVVGMCIAILMKNRYSKMCLVQKIVSLVLYAGHSGKQVSLWHQYSCVVIAILIYMYRCTQDCKN